MPMHRASPMDPLVLAGVCEEGLLLVLLAPSAFALEIQAPCKQHDSPWKPFTAGHKRVNEGAHYCLDLGRKNTQLPFHWALRGPERHTWDFCRRNPRHSTGTPQPSSFQRPEPKAARVWVAGNVGLPSRPPSADPGRVPLAAAAARDAMPRARPAEPPPARGAQGTAALPGAAACAPGPGGEMRGALEGAPRGSAAPPPPPPRPGPRRRSGFAPRFPGKAQPSSGHVSRRDPTGPAAAPPAGAAESARYRRLFLRSVGSAGEAAEGMSAEGAEADGAPPRPCARFLLQ